MCFHINVQCVIILESDCLAISVFGPDDIGCDSTQTVDCAVLTLNGIDSKPFEFFPIDGAGRGIARILLDINSCSVLVRATKDSHVNQYLIPDLFMINSFNMLIIFFLTINHILRQSNHIKHCFKQYFQIENCTFSKQITFALWQFLYGKNTQNVILLSIHSL